MTNIRIPIYGIFLQVCIALTMLYVLASCSKQQTEIKVEEFPNIFDQIDSIKLEKPKKSQT